MMYESVIRDFAERTRTNLRAIEGLRNNGQEVYEVTQLVNSMLGLLVFPREEFVDQIPQTPLNELQANGWPIPKVVGGFPQARDLRQLVSYLRNAIAHFNIQFIGDATNEIRILKLWNTDLRTHRKTWEAEVGLDELRGISERFIDLLLTDGRPTRR